MGNKYNTLAVLLAYYALHQQPAWVPSNCTALIMLSWAPVCLTYLLVVQGINLNAPILGLSQALVANQIRLRPAINWEEIIHFLHLPAPQEQALCQALHQ
ncbi:hypothetical protein BDW71DRAFT_211884 [Aspergillus fruticulosus]